MKALLIAASLAVLAGSGQAGEMALDNARVVDRNDITDPAFAAKTVADGWFAFVYPAVEGTRTPCCWRGDWKADTTIGCSLERDFHSYGTTAAAPAEDTIVAYVRVEGGAVERLKVAGGHCPMDADGRTVTWIGDTDAGDTLDWLEERARYGHEERVGHAALWALALHASGDAISRLEKLARTPGSDRSEEAVFWLGETRGQAGFAALEDLLDDLPVGKTRRHINAALGMNDSDEARALLVHIAKSDRDPEQRAESLFWLANSYPGSAMGPIMDAIRNDRDAGVLDQAVFALSQLPDEVAGPALLELAGNPDLPREARRQALFWLVHEGDEESVSALTEMLTH